MPVLLYEKPPATKVGTIQNAQSTVKPFAETRQLDAASC